MGCDIISIIVGGIMFILYRKAEKKGKRTQAFFWVVGSAFLIAFPVLSWLLMGRLLIVEIIMLVSGAFLLIAGKFKLAQNRVLEGWKARVAGLFLAVPLPLALVIGLLVGLLISIGSLPVSVQGYAAIAELLLVLGGLIGALAFAATVKPKKAAVRHDPADIDQVVQTSVCPKCGEGNPPNTRYCQICGQSLQ